MKIAILGDGELTFCELQKLFSDSIDEILVDINSVKREEIEKFCKVNGIKLTFRELTDGENTIFNVFDAVIFSDEHLSFRGRDNEGKRYFKYFASDRAEYDVVIDNNSYILIHKSL